MAATFKRLKRPAASVAASHHRGQREYRGAAWGRGRLLRQLPSA